MTEKSTFTEQDQPTVLLQEAPLRDLLAAGMVNSVLVKGISGGFVLEVMIGGRSVFLANARGSKRLFASLETVGILLGRMGQQRFEVDFSGFETGRIRAARPERSAAMKAGRLPKKVVKKNGSLLTIKRKK